MGMNRKEAEEYLLSVGIHPNFGYAGVGDSFLIGKATICKALDEKKDDVGLWDVLGISCGDYNTAIDEHILSVMEEINKGPCFVTDLSETLGLDRHYVELIQYLICSAEMGEYGTSPRGCWLTDYGKFILKVLVRNKEA